jgi:hypothetical protein
MLGKLALFPSKKGAQLDEKQGELRLIVRQSESISCITQQERCTDDWQAHAHISAISATRNEHAACRRGGMGPTGILDPTA